MPELRPSRPAAAAQEHAADRAVVWLFVLLAAVAASFLVVNMPPYQGPDETNHFLRADNIARGALLGHRFGPGQIAAGGFAAPEIASSGAQFDAPKFHPERKVTREMFDRGMLHFGAAAVEEPFSNTAPYSPVFYLPSVAALTIGKLGRMTVIQTLYLARGLTAVAAAGLIAWALFLCASAGAGAAAWGMFAVAALPMSLSLQASCSQDGLMLAAAALAGGCFVRLRAAAAAGLAAPMPEYMLLCLCLALMAMARAPYAALALLPLFLRLRPAARIAGAVAVLAAAVLWAVAAALVVGVEQLPGRDPAGQIRLLLDPARDVHLMIDTAVTQWPVLLTSFIGRLGWLDTGLPLWFIGVAGWGLVLLALAGWSLRGAEAAGVLLATLVTIVGVMLAIYVAWTDYGRPVIEGAQGRYFLPLALLLAGLGTRLPRGLPGWAVRAVATAIPIVGLAVTMRAVVLRYYLT